MTKEEAREWFENRMDRKLIPGAREAYKVALSALTQRNEPLTLDELIGMDGEPAWWDAGKESCWGIIRVDSFGIFAGIPYFRGRWRGVNFEYGIEARGMTLYRRPPERRRPCEML